jgi:hypothetical protein
MRRPTKRRLPAPGQLALPTSVPRLIVGPMLVLTDDDGHPPSCERALELAHPYRWAPGDPVVRFR